MTTYAARPSRPSQTQPPVSPRLISSLPWQQPYVLVMCAMEEEASWDAEPASFLEPPSLLEPPSMLEDFSGFGATVGTSPAPSEFAQRSEELLRGLQ